MTFVIRLAVDLNDVQTRYHTLQRTGNVRVGAAFDGFAGEVLDGTYQLSLFQRTVTYDYDIVDGFGVFFHDNVDNGAVIDGLCNVRIADIGEYDFRIGCG